jgi:hypothetical protein
MDMLCCPDWAEGEGATSFPVSKISLRLMVARGRLTGWTLGLMLIIPLMLGLELTGD